MTDARERRLSYKRVGDLEACLPCRFLRVACKRDQNWTPGAPCEQCRWQGIICALDGVEQQKLRQNAELADLEIFKSARMGLVDEYFATQEAVFPSFYRVALKSAASSQFKAVPQTTKALLAAMVATSARSTVHPFVIGNVPPAAQFSYDPQVATRREATCSALVNKAIQIASEAGVLRRAGPVEVSILFMISIILPPKDPQRKSLLLICGGHERQLQEDAGMGDVATPQLFIMNRVQYQLSSFCLGWAPFLYDGWTIREMGRLSLTHSDDMVVAFSESVAARTGCRGLLDACSRSAVDALRYSFELLVKADRLVIKHGFATQNTVSYDSGKTASIYAALDQAFLLRSHALALAAHDPQAKFIHRNLGYAASTACRLTLPLGAFLRPILGFDAWQAQCQIRSLRECRCLVETFRGLMEHQKVQLSTIGRVMRPIWDEVVDCILEAPVAISPGAPDMMTWTTAEKMATITSAAIVVEHHAWSWPESVPTLQKLQAALRYRDRDSASVDASDGLAIGPGSSPRLAT